MTSIPPLKPQNPDSPSHISGVGKKPRGADTMRYLLGSWSVMVFGELVHQLTNSVGLILDPRRCARRPPTPPATAARRSRT